MRDTRKPRVYKRGPYWIAQVFWAESSSTSYTCGSWAKAVDIALRGGYPLVAEVPC